MSARDPHQIPQSLPADPPVTPPETSDEQRVLIVGDLSAAGRTTLTAAIAEVAASNGTAIVPVFEAAAPEAKPDPPTIRPSRPPLRTEEQAQAARAGRNVMRAIATESARITLLARYALIEAIRDSAISDLKRMDEAIAQAEKMKFELLANARAKISADTAKAGEVGSQIPAPLTEEEL